jgi:hypothetical protein
MSSDAPTAKELKPGEHITFADCPGLRLVAIAKRKTWTYRFRSPVDGRIRQGRLGAWPALSALKPITEWSRVKEPCDAGTDMAVVRRKQRQETYQTKPVIAAKPRASNWWDDEMRGQSHSRGKNRKCPC